jgi:hypothetical protein
MTAAKQKRVSMSRSAYGRLASAIAVAGLALLLAGGPKTAMAQGMPAGGLDKTHEDELAHKHDGYYGALAPQNLAKQRPKPPFNLTGTWFINLRKSFGDFMFGPPYPEFNEAGKQAMVDAAAAMKAGKAYRDSIGQCYPAGMPMIMTRVWPIDIIQLPTSVHMIFGLTSPFPPTTGNRSGTGKEARWL